MRANDSSYLKTNSDLENYNKKRKFYMKLITCQGKISIDLVKNNLKQTRTAMKFQYAVENVH